MASKILFISGTEPHHEALEKSLASHASRFSMITTKSGNEAYVKSRNQAFDAVVTSLTLPGLSGCDLINALKENYTNSKIPIVVYGEFGSDVAEELKQYSDVHIFPPNQSPEIVGDFLDSILKKGAHTAAPTSVKFDVNFINPFITAVVHTLQTVADAKNIKNSKPYLLKKGERLGVDISGAVSMISPQFNGVLATCFPTQTYLNVVGRMLGEEYKEITSDIEDAAGELTNIIFGQTKKSLEQNGLQLEKAIPSVIRGSNHSLTHQSTGPILVLPFETDMGPLFIQICMLQTL